MPSLISLYLFTATLATSKAESLRSTQNLNEKMIPIDVTSRNHAKFSRSDPVLRSEDEARMMDIDRAQDVILTPLKEVLGSTFRTTTNGGHASNINAIVNKVEDQTKAGAKDKLAAANAHTAANAHDTAYEPDPAYKKALADVFAFVEPLKATGSAYGAQKLAHSQAAVHASAHSQAAVHAPAYVQAAFHAPAVAQTAIHAPADAQAAVHAPADAQTAVHAPAPFDVIDILSDDESAARVFSDDESAVHTLSDAESALHAPVYTETAVQDPPLAQAAANAHDNYVIPTVKAPDELSERFTYDCKMTQRALTSKLSKWPPEKAARFQKNCPPFENFLLKSESDSFYKESLIQLLQWLESRPGTKQVFAMYFPEVYGLAYTQGFQIERLPIIQEFLNDQKKLAPAIKEFLAAELPAAMDIVAAHNNDILSLSSNFRSTLSLNADVKEVVYSMLRHHKAPWEVFLELGRSYDKTKTSSVQAYHLFTQFHVACHFIMWLENKWNKVIIDVDKSI
ncbi:uncharacterized protein PHALS_07664 [Plasmopara halstedii]|uniref:RxLR-like protein n=1 Tax=Plasmopara halstedii TaxID=4781 RepID=A0A0P1B6Y5_PLAHL|nr:uncharacterized protein PHALS_07664 [Plasmopara halstedii]CEG49928.1 hypothetical protein PHALS_07664 [Plasmopara halstedii]|eukprot:XP_024586297.1 hypothetical protein PHALS_07664 [Plasmopara halstedii]